MIMLKTAISETINLEFTRTHHDLSKKKAIFAKCNFYT
jgi:hypothetical protein